MNASSRASATKTSCAPASSAPTSSHPSSPWSRAPACAPPLGTTTRTGLSGRFPSPNRACRSTCAAVLICNCGLRSQAGPSTISSASTRCGSRPLRFWLATLSARSPCAPTRNRHAVSPRSPWGRRLTSSTTCGPIFPRSTLRASTYYTSARAAALALPAWRWANRSEQPHPLRLSSWKTACSSACPPASPAPTIRHCACSSQPRYSPLPPRSPARSPTVSARSCHSRLSVATPAKRCRPIACTCWGRRTLPQARSRN